MLRDGQLGVAGYPRLLARELGLALRREALDQRAADAQTQEKYVATETERVEERIEQVRRTIMTEAVG